MSRICSARYGARRCVVGDRAHRAECGFDAAGMRLRRLPGQPARLRVARAATVVPREGIYALAMNASGFFCGLPPKSSVATPAVLPVIALAGSRHTSGAASASRREETKSPICRTMQLIVVSTLDGARLKLLCLCPREGARSRTIRARNMFRSSEGFHDAIAL